MVRQRVTLPEPEGPRRMTTALSHGKVDVLQNMIGAVVFVDISNFDEVFFALRELSVRTS